MKVAASARTVRELPFWQRFRTRLGLLILLLVLPAFGLVVQSYVAQRRLQQSAIRDNAKALSELVAASQEDIIKNAQQLLGTLTQFPFLVLSDNARGSQWHLANLLKLSPDYVNFGLIETNGVLFCNGAKTNETADLSDDYYFQQVVSNGRFAVGNFQADPLSGEAALSVGYPVPDTAGHLKRVLFASLRVSKLSEAVTHVKLPVGGSILIIDRTGKQLANVPRRGTAVGVYLAATPLVKRILAQNESVFSMDGLDGVPQLHAVTPIQNGERQACMFACVSIPLSVALAQANQTLLRNCLGLAIVALLVSGAAWFYSRQFFLRPVTSLASAAQALAQGNLQARTGSIRGVAELIQLGEVFDQMAERLEERQNEMVRLNDALRLEVTERQRAEHRLIEQAEEQRKLEQQFLRAQRMESLGALSGGIAHDLNNALGPILMSAELLRESRDENQERREWLDLIQSGAQRCAKLVKQIVNFAKGSRPQTEPLKVSRVIDEMVKIARETFPKSISVESRVAVEEMTISGDATELHQVLMNLCVNARDAMPEGGLLSISAQPVNLSDSQLRFHPNAARHPHVLLIVQDTGSGMAPETKDRIFEPFFTTKSADKGTGLGLSTVATIVHRQNGFIEVESEVGTGTAFKIFLPMAVSNLTLDPKLDLEPFATGHGELILVADDEQVMLELAKSTLENYGYRVITARNGLEAVSCVELYKAELRLLLTDTDMPVLAGVKAIRAIQRIRPDMPVIIASGIEADLKSVDQIDHGRITTLNKPYGARQLLEAVCQALKAGRS